MQEIIDSIHNGQRKQALRMCINSQFTLDDLFEELYQHAMFYEIIIMYRIAVNHDYLTFKE